MTGGRREARPAQGDGRGLLGQGLLKADFDKIIRDVDYSNAGSGDWVTLLLLSH